MSNVLCYAMMTSLSDAAGKYEAILTIFGQFKARDTPHKVK